MSAWLFIHFTNWGEDNFTEVPELGLNTSPIWFQFHLLCLIASAQMSLVIWSHVYWTNWIEVNFTGSPPQRWLSCLRVWTMGHHVTWREKMKTILQYHSIWQDSVSVCQCNNEPQSESNIMTKVVQPWPNMTVNHNTLYISISSAMKVHDKNLQMNHNG